MTKKQKKKQHGAKQNTCKDILVHGSQKIGDHPHDQPMCAKVRTIL